MRIAAELKKAVFLAPGYLPFVFIRFSSLPPRVLVSTLSKTRPLKLVSL